MGTAREPTTADGLFGARLKAARRRKGWPARELHEHVARLGGSLSRGTIAKIENGLREVSLGEAFLLAAALGVQPLALIAPLPEDGEVRLSESRTVDATAAWRWFHGDEPLEPERDNRFFYNEVLVFRVSESLRFQEAMVTTWENLIVMAEDEGDEETADRGRRELAKAQRELRELRKGALSRAAQVVVRGGETGRRARDARFAEPEED